MEPQAQLHTTQVDLSGLLTVLGSNLYSTPEVAIRELVQNAHDACVRRALESEATGDKPPPALIRVGAIPDKGRIWIEDNGAGLTGAEMQQYLATIGAGYTRVLRQDHGEAGLIGAFGLGFLSAYMIGQKVDVMSTSWSRPDEGAHFRTDSGRTYILQATPPRAIGSRVEIELKADLAPLSQFDALARIVRYHCCLLKIPVILDWSGEQVNAFEAPWRESAAGKPAVRLRKERLAFAEAFEPIFTPVCTLPLQAPEAATGGGLVWIHDTGTYGSLDNRRLSIFVNGMRVCGNERELLPSWAGFVSGIYESATLVPTTSREDVKHDAAYYAAQAQIAADLAAGLASLARAEPEVWRRVLRRHNESLLGAAIANPDLFEAIRNDLQVPTSQGDLTLSEVHKRSDGRIYVASSDEDGPEAILANVLGVPVINGLRYGAYGFARKWAECEGVTLVDVASASGIGTLFPEVTPEAPVAAALERWFGATARVRPARFEPRALPLLVLTDREARTKAFMESDAADARFSAGVLAMARLYTETVEAGPQRTVIVNLDCPAIQTALAQADSRHGPAIGALLMAVGNILSGRGEAESGRRLADSLEIFSASLTAILKETQ